MALNFSGMNSKVLCYKPIIFHGLRPKHALSDFDHLLFTIVLKTCVSAGDLVVFFILLVVNLSVLALFCAVQESYLASKFFYFLV